jgi:hypothetical protein
MAKKSVANGADAFGDLLNALGTVVILLAVGVSAYLCIRVHGDQLTYADGNQTPGASFQGVGYLASIGIGIGGVVLGVLMLWAGTVLRLLSEIARRPENVVPAPRATSAGIDQDFTPLVNPPPLPRFDGPSR